MAIEKPCWTHACIPQKQKFYKMYHYSYMEKEKYIFKGKECTLYKAHTLQQEVS
jgi:hypothetical protein